MIINHARCLHVGIANGGAKKLEAAFFHVLADGVGNGCTCRRYSRKIIDRLAIGHKAVQVFIKRTELFLDINK